MKYPGAGSVRRRHAPLVSVVTPSYNAADFIRHTITSVQDQEYPAVEHIVIDGGSTDGTIDILRGRPGLTWKSEPDNGQTEAINKGLRQAQGEIVAWLNADDTYQPNAIERAVSFLQQHPKAAGVYSDCWFVDEHNVPFTLFKAERFDYRTLLLKNYIPNATVFLRRWVVDEIGPLNEQLNLVLDWEYWLRIGRKYHMEYFPDAVLANFRLCGGTKSAENSADFDLEYLDVLSEILQQSPYRELPGWWRWWAKRLARSRHYMARTFSAYRQSQHAEIRYVILRGLALNPGWLWNRGVISILLNAFLIHPTASVLSRSEPKTENLSNDEDGA